MFNALTSLSHSRQVALWLFSCCAMIVAMTIIGAITRLTESGLSITEWNVLMGILPPLNEAQWLSEFEKYKATPEFLQKHYWMNLDDFKNIYFWEWFHRLWGRLIGLVYAMPLAYFWVKNKIPQGYKPRLLIFLGLGGLQGFMGWFMVQSGLVDQPDVSHYRLAMHLSLALIIFALLFWTALTLWSKDAPSKPPLGSKALRIHGHVASLFLALTIIWGAFVAGLEAGMMYNQFPLMGQKMVPSEMWAMTPAWLNLFENHASVQFTHRWIAMITGLVILSYAAHGLKYAPKLFGLLGLWVFVQIGLGIKTLLAFGAESGLNAVSIHLAAIHQLGAVILLTLMIAAMFVTRRPR
jgi:heme a synthase